MGAIYAALGKHEQAINAYDEALQARPHITARARAMALHGRGVQLIDLKQLDLAEVCLKESLLYEPSSRLALNELKYIAHLKSGGDIALPGGLGVSAVGQEHGCAICGKELTPQSGKAYEVVNIKGRVLPICPDCAEKHSKRWWQFWK